MQLPTSLLLAATLAAIPALAAPVAPAKSMAVADAAEWTIETFTRTCADTSFCDYYFFVDTHVSAVPTCNYRIWANGAIAQNTNYNGISCGVFTISSGWSGQFGPGNGFSTLAVTDGHNIVYPAYTDNQLVNGQAVSPDQSYPVQVIA